eukprot:CAMPEP_0172946482 /NCGR_PEP_ID=MMETSP1075-20121228/227085_1 /TAXON_ID=2916 /ORGANISM="Ceratium fusus, Strain PA161109" /LENGTH=32 /DNA_ID= /DNA_START= /DNA_END= /DNA_ORIENTATION=
MKDSVTQPRALTRKQVAADQRKNSDAASGAGP